MLDDRSVTPSSRDERWIVWTAETNRRAWQAVLGDRDGSDMLSGYDAAPRAEELAGLPPTYIDVGDMEVFRDECIEYATRLWRAGINTELHVYPGCAHGSDILAPDAAVSRTAREVRYAALARAFRD